ncbi:hypothetical protein EV356DRAFT_505792 [Viridothelium virens]|uniref:Uncharacterized protein n=1 Tax=Viridothelium virens TaxID=1048519 RepID=A0A6A6HK33_VIRVR|nr:hypothetical protein EV356DRAFT_505792 [Viridothelium virens]
MMINEAKLHNRHLDDWTDEEREKVKFMYQAGFDRLQAYVDQAQAEDKILFVKEHANFMATPLKQSEYAWSRNIVHETDWKPEFPQLRGSKVQYSTLNDTVLPDSFLHQIQPTFLIRHPALVFPSNLRVTMKNHGETSTEVIKRMALDISMTMRWSRRLYDFYTTDHPLASRRSRAQPVIIDAYDVTNAPRQLLPRFCALTGLDASKLTFTWQRTPDEIRARLTEATGPAIASYLSTIWASEGIMKEKALDSPEAIDIDAEARKWREEFGEDEARRLEEWVRQAMPDYHYLWERRLKPKPKGKEEEKEAKINVKPSRPLVLEKLLSALRSVRRLLQKL